MTRFRLAAAVFSCGCALAAGPPGVTSLTNPKVTYQRAAAPSVTLRRGPVTAVIVDHSPLNAGHRAGYNGLASLAHRAQPDDLFVPLYAGLHFELMFDGAEQPRDVMFEPRRARMELRLVSRTVVELYQAPMPHWKLESCTRSALDPRGVVLMTFACIPRARTFRHG